jgi:hypothetical protein
MNTPALRFLADESCDFAVVRALRDEGYDVLAVSEYMRRSDDRALVEQAAQERRVLLTEDDETVIHKSHAHRLYVQTMYIYPNRYDCIGWSLEAPPGQVCGTMACKWPGFLSLGWHHVALIYDRDTGNVGTYYDGKRYSNRYCPNVVSSDESLRVGPTLRGLVDEIRISDIVRYSGGFAPSASPFTCDARTRALWHFDEFEGTTVFHDACGADNLLLGRNGAHTEGVLKRQVFMPVVLR